MGHPVDVIGSILGFLPTETLPRVLKTNFLVKTTLKYRYFTLPEVALIRTKGDRTVLLENPTLTKFMTFGLALKLNRLDVIITLVKGWSYEYAIRCAVSTKRYEIAKYLLENTDLPVSTGTSYRIIAFKPTNLVKTLIKTRPENIDFPSLQAAACSNRFEIFKQIYKKHPTDDLIELNTCLISFSIRENLSAVKFMLEIGFEVLHKCLKFLLRFQPDVILNWKNVNLDRGTITDAFSEVCWLRSMDRVDRKSIYLLKPLVSEPDRKRIMKRYLRRFLMVKDMKRAKILFRRLDGVDDDVIDELLKTQAHSPLDEVLVGKKFTTVQDYLNFLDGDKDLACLLALHNRADSGILKDLIENYGSMRSMRSLMRGVAYNTNNFPGFCQIFDKCMRTYTRKNDSVLFVISGALRAQNLKICQYLVKKLKGKVDKYDLLNINFILGRRGEDLKIFLQILRTVRGLYKVTARAIKAGLGRHGPEVIEEILRNYNGPKLRLEDVFWSPKVYFGRKNKKLRILMKSDIIEFVPEDIKYLKKVGNRKLLGRLMRYKVFNPLGLNFFDFVAGLAWKFPTK